MEKSKEMEGSNRTSTRMERNEKKGLDKNKEKIRTSTKSQ